MILIPILQYGKNNYHSHYPFLNLIYDYQSGFFFNFTC